MYFDMRFVGGRKREYEDRAAHDILYSNKTAPTEQQPNDSAPHRAPDFWNLPPYPMRSSSSCFPLPPFLDPLRSLTEI
jgi:hypothetical protein